MDDNVFDSEKAFKDAVEPGRRAFLKKMTSLAAGAIAAAKTLPANPDPIPPAPQVPLHIRSVGYDDNNYGVVYSTTSCSTCDMGMYTCLPSYAWNEKAWFPYQGPVKPEDLHGRYEERMDAVRKKR